MRKESKAYDVRPADRLASVSEYYFSKKLKEIAAMNAAGRQVINLGVGSPDLPPSKEAVEAFCRVKTAHAVDWFLCDCGLFAAALISVAEWRTRTCSSAI